MTSDPCNEVTLQAPPRVWNVNMDCPNCGCRITMQTARAGGAGLVKGKALETEIRKMIPTFEGQPFHYRDAFNRMDCAVSGKDPLATFLTTMSRMPEVVRVGSGVYQGTPT